MGINRYVDSLFEPLVGPNRDAAAISAVLAQRFGFESVRLLVDQRPNPPAPDGVIADVVPEITRAVLMERLAALKLEVKAGDAVLFFFAGHGTRAAKRGYIVPSRGDPDRPGTLLDLADAARELRSFDAHHTLMILDCCFSGVALEPGSGLDGAVGVLESQASRLVGGDNLDRVFSRRAFQVITAGAGTEEVGDVVRLSKQYADLARTQPEFQGHSPFTAVLLQALRGLTGLPDGRQLASDLGYYLYLTLVNDNRLRGVRQAPRYGTFGGGEGDFLFIPSRPVLNPRLLSPLYLTGEAYAELRQSACQALRQVIKSEDDPARRRPLIREAVPHLGRLLSDRQGEARASAAQALADLAEDASPELPEFSELVAPLTVILGDETQSHALQRDAARTLGRLVDFIDDASLRAFIAYVDRLDRQWKLVEARLAARLRIPPERFTLPDELRAKLDRVSLPNEPAATASYRERLTFAEARRQRLDLLSPDAVEVYLRDHEQGKALLKQATTLLGNRDGMDARITAGRALGDFKGVPQAAGAQAPNFRRLLVPGTPESRQAGEILAGPPRARLIWMSPSSLHHESQVGHVAYSPDGRILASSDMDGRIRLWDTATRARLRELAGHEGWVFGLAFSPDGSTLASAGADATVRLWVVANGQEKARLEGHRTSVTCVAFSPDGAALASSSDDGTARIWDIETRRERTMFRPPDRPSGVLFSPDGRTLFTPGWDAIHRWDVATGNEKPLPGVPTGVAVHAALSPDGSTLAIGLGVDRIVLWDTSAGAAAVPLPGADSGLIDQLAFSPDGRTLAAAGDRGDIRLWDVIARKQLPSLGRPPSRVNGLAFSPDRRTLATANEDGTIRVWDLSDRRELGEPDRVSERFFAVAFSPDGRKFATGGDDGVVRCWDVATGAVASRLVGHAGEIRSVAYAPRGDLVVSCGRDGVRLWEPGTGRNRSHLQGHNGLVYCVAFSPDGESLASAGFDETIRIWDVKAGTERAKLEGHVERVNAVAFSPDGRTLASAGNDRTVRIWDARTGTERHRFAGHGSWAGGVAFSPNGQTVASVGDDRLVRLWDVDKGREIRRFDARYGNTGADPTDPTARSHWVGGVAFSPDGDLLAASCGDRLVRLWDVRNGGEIARLDGHADRVGGLAFSPDGRILASAGEDRTVRLWDVADGAESRRFDTPCVRLNAVAFSPDGHIVAAAGQEGPIGLWSTMTGVAMRTLNPTSWINGLAFSPDGQTLATAGEDRTVRLWNLKTGQLRDPLRGHLTPVHAVAYAPDGRTLASAGEDGSIRLWDPSNGHPIGSLDEPFLKVNSLAFSPDGETLASDSEDLSVRLWDFKSGKERASLKGGHSIWITGLSFRPDGKMLASASDDGTIVLWDVAARAARHKLEGHRGYVRGVAFSPDGRTVISGGFDETVRVWDASDGTELARLEGHTEYVNGVAFSPDGRTLASVSDDATVRLWNTPSRFDPAIYAPLVQFRDLDHIWKIGTTEDLFKSRQYGYLGDLGTTYIDTLRGEGRQAGVDVQLFRGVLSADNLEGAFLMFGALKNDRDRDVLRRELATALRQACRLSMDEGGPGLAERRLNQVRDVSPDDPDNDYFAARIAMMSGAAGRAGPSRDAAYDLLERAVKKGFVDWDRLKTDPVFAPLQSEERYRLLLAPSKSPQKPADLPPGVDPP